MTQHRFAPERDALIRDLVRDYCIVRHRMAEQRRRFAADGSVSYATLNALLGEAVNKGVFWRLKDTSQRLFRVRPRPSAKDAAALENLIDWCIGYAFHECVKLREDAYQYQHYGHKLMQIAHTPAAAPLCHALRGLERQTSLSTARELARMFYVLDHGLQFLAYALSRERHNTCLARWLISEAALAKAAFGKHYALLLRCLCDGREEHLLALAAKDFLQAGRRTSAKALLTAARAQGRLDAEGRALLANLEEKEAALADSDVCTFCVREDGKHCTSPDFFQTEKPDAPASQYGEESPCAAV